MGNIKKVLKAVLLIIISVIAITGNIGTKSYAATNSSGVYFNLYNGAARPTGTYKVLTGSSSGNTKNVIKIIETNSSGATQTVETRNAAVYCLKNGVGFGLNNDGRRNSVKYTEYFYLNDPTDGLYTNSAYSIYRNVLPDNANGTNYNKLLWLLNNICRPEDTISKNALLNAAARYVGKTRLDFSVYQVPGKTSTEVEKDIIEVVQQAAIWYFTNPSGEFHPFYDKTSGGNFYLDGTALEDHARTSSGGSIGLLPTDVPHLALYKYLIDKANSNGSYTPASAASPVSFDKSRATVTTTDTAFLIGPYSLTGNATGVTLSATITDGSNNSLSVQLLGANKSTQLSGSTIADKIKNNINKDFYISLPLSTNINSVKLNIGANYSRKVLKYWSVPASSVATEQPLIVIKEESGHDTWNDQKNIEKPEFDLALRKFITQIKDKNGKNRTFASREPQITQSDLQALANGTSILDNGKTTKKQHTKDPLLVETGDTVTYTIRIYNEGEVDGKATEITDYLPTGLELKEGSSINQTYGWTKDSSNSRAIKTTYLRNTNLAHFNKTSLAIKYADVQVECTVTANPEANNKNLKNVAEISAYSNTGNLTDRDSQVPNVHHNDNNSNYTGTQNRIGRGEQDDDDYEELYMQGKYFDLALRKHISAVNNTAYNRAPVVDVTPLKNGQTTATYKHRKDTITVGVGDIVTYTLNIYNEGQVDGYAQKIVDHLPEYLEFISDSSSTDQAIREATEFNNSYGWKIDTTDTTKRTIYTTKLSKENNSNNIIKAFDQTKNNLETPKELKIKCIVKDNAPALKELTNIAEIAEYYNELDLPDRDNTAKVTLPTDANLPNYRGHNDNSNLDPVNSNNYFKGQEDDDDFEKVVVKRFDLALKKFIAKVNEGELKTEGAYDRAPTVDTSKYGTVVEGKEITTFEYSFKQNPEKDPVRVEHNDIVTYIIRVYNEGSKSGYAAEIKDDIPDGLEFLPENETNQTYRWIMLDENGNVTTDVKQAKAIRTDYLSKENGKANTKGDSGYDKSNSNLLLAYDRETMGQNPDYADVKVAFKVGIPNTSDRIIINKAQISNDKDENNEDVIDIDSTPDKWIEEEDDQDIEKIYVKYFDLALRKWVTHAIVIEDGVQKEMETDHYAEQEPEPAVKVEVNEKRLKETVIKFRYSIRITNEGEIDGYATEISDYVPQGLKFNQADNPLWKEENGKITTDQLKDKLLKPGESAIVELVLTWINDENNMGVMTNWAEISKDKNDSDTPDIDSIPNNKKEDEDDMDYAPVVLAVISGIAPKYIAISGGAFMIVAAGVFLIKKFVL